MSEGLNKAILTGHLTRDPELRFTGGGSPVCNLRLANNHWGGKERGEETTFVDVVVWGDQGECQAKWLSKGDNITVEGKLVTNEWENDQGDKRSKLEIWANKVFWHKIQNGNDDRGGGGRGQQRKGSRQREGGRRRARNDGGGRGPQRRDGGRKDGGGLF